MTALQPIHDTLSKDYPYRSWEDIYRREYTQDVVGHAAHCVNCHGNCAFKVIAKDGIVIREEQLAQYPQVHPDYPSAFLGSAHHSDQCPYLIYRSHPYRPDQYHLRSLYCPA